MDRSFNSSKSDKLPSLDTYFDGYFKLQQSAVEIISDKAPLEFAGACFIISLVCAGGNWLRQGQLSKESEQEE